MKKLLIIALIANVAITAHANVAGAFGNGFDNVARVITAPYRIVKKAAKAIGSTVKDAGTEFKDLGVETFAEIRDGAKGAAQTVKDSEVFQEASDVAGQFAAFPVQLGGDIKDGFNATVDATKNVGKKIADSRFVAKAKDTNQAIVDATKKAATKVKDAAYDVAHSEAIEDTKDVLGQFAAPVREAWVSFAALFKATKEKLA